MSVTNPIYNITPQNFLKAVNGVMGDGVTNYQAQCNLRTAQIQLRHINIGFDISKNHRHQASISPNMILASELKS
jgi:hypothetical protein